MFNKTRANVAKVRNGARNVKNGATLTRDNVAKAAGKGYPCGCGSCKKKVKKEGAITVECANRMVGDPNWAS